MPWAGTSLGIMVTTASPTVFFAATGDVAKAKQKAAGAPEDREGVGPNAVHH